MAGPIKISILANAAQAKKEINGVATSAEQMGKKTSRVGGLLKGALIGAGVLAGLSVLKNKFSEAGQAVQEQQKLMAQTKTVLKSTGAAAGVSAKGVLALSDAIERKSTLDSEAIQSGQNLLLTFTNIKNAAGKGNDVFTQTTKIMADMSTALGQDTKASAIQLGKALNNPIKGVSALSKVGVSFSDQQKAVIKRLQETGDTAGAQKVILKELNKEFGGSANAAGKTAAGQFKHLKDMIDGAFESVVKVALPVLVNIATFLTTKLPVAIAAAQPYLDRFKAGFATVAPVLGAVFGFLSNNKATIAAFAGVLLTVVAAVRIWTAAQAVLNVVLSANPISLVVLAIAALVAGFVYAYRHCETFRNIVNRAWAGIRAATAAVFPVIKAIVVGTFRVVAAVVRTSVAVVKAAVTTAWRVISAVTRGAWAVVKFAIVNPIKAAASMVRGRATAIRAALVAAWNAAKAATSRIWNGIKTAVRSAISAVVGVVKGIHGKITGAFSGAAGWLASAGRNIVHGLIAGIESMIGAVKAKLHFLTNLIPKHKGPPAKDRKLLTPAGRWIMQSLINGLREKDLIVHLSRITKVAKRQFTHIANVLVKKMDFAKKALADLKKTSSDYATQVRDAITSTGNVTDFLNGNTAMTGDGAASSIIDSLKDNLAKQKTFAALIARLTAMKLNDTSLQQIIDKGADGGTSTAQALISGGSSVIKKVNGLTSQLATTAKAMGKSTANHFYGAGIAAAQGLVKGLQSKETQLIRAAAHMGKKFAAALRKVLGIRSPSRVFASIGRFTTLGLAQGIADSSALMKVRRASTRMAGAIETGYTPALALAGSGGTGGTTYNVTINVQVPIGASQVETGRQVSKALDAYLSAGGRRKAA